jgi:hypothetical protein
MTRLSASAVPSSRIRVGTCPSGFSARIVGAGRRPRTRPGRPDRAAAGGGPPDQPRRHDPGGEAQRAGPAAGNRPPCPRWSRYSQMTRLSASAVPSSRFYAKASPFVRKVLVAAHELGLADRIELLPAAAHHQHLADEGRGLGVEQLHRVSSGFSSFSSSSGRLLRSADEAPRHWPTGSSCCRRRPTRSTATPRSGRRIRSGRCRP